MADCFIYLFTNVDSMFFLTENMFTEQELCSVISDVYNFLINEEGAECLDNIRESFNLQVGTEWEIVETSGMYSKSPRLCFLMSLSFEEHQTQNPDQVEELAASKTKTK